VLARVAIDGAERRAVGAPSVPHGPQNAVDEQGAALLVLGGSHREGVGRRLVPGGTAERLLTGASCPLLVAEGPLAAAGAVVVAYDATPEADAALDWAAPLAARLGSPLALWHVTAPTVPRRTSDPALYREFTSYIHRVAERILAKGVERLPSGAAASTAVMEGEVGETLAHRAAAKPAALVVCGSRGYGPARTVLMGSTARSLLSHATCPVAVVPRG
jgi:nucleotide-binding universal stress UspA family protein